MTQQTKSTFEKVEANLAKRYAREARFKAYGIASIAFGGLFLIILFISIIGGGYTAFQQTQVQLEVHFDNDELEITDFKDKQQFYDANFTSLARKSLLAKFDDVEGRRDRMRLYSMLSSHAELKLRKMLYDDPSLIGTTQKIWLLADDDVDAYLKGHIKKSTPEQHRRVKDKQINWIEKLQQQDALKLKFNTMFFTNGDSREPEQAGIKGALKGSFYTLLVTLILSFPIGVAAAVYLEEFAPQNKWTDMIEVNINNLAAVPSIVFGLLGLAIFINFFSLPRSAPLVGGLVLTLMTLPTIIIASRAALKSVPPSIREAALGMGASKTQVVTHHVLPLAMPGMLTGTIIGMAQALGETAPLLMIGMVAFIADIPTGITSPATVLPVQIYLWSENPERGFTERTSAAIMMLLTFLIFMNAAAVYLRKRFERRW